MKLTFNLDQHLHDIKNIFMQNMLPEIEMLYVASMTLLFFVYSPLYFDKPQRQKAMLANALRLYCAYGF